MKNHYLLWVCLLFSVVTGAQTTDPVYTEIALQQYLKTDMTLLRIEESKKDTPLMGKLMGSIGSIYLELAQKQDEKIQNDETAKIRKAYLKLSVQYLKQGVQIGEMVGNKEQLINDYGDLSTAQRMQGYLGAALKSHKKRMELKNSIINTKETSNVGRNEIEYRHKMLEDSLHKKEIAVEALLKEKENALLKKQKKLDSSLQSLTASQKEKTLFSKQLKNTEDDLSKERQYLLEKDRMLIKAEREESLRDSMLEMEKNKRELAERENRLQQGREELHAQEDAMQQKELNIKNRQLKTDKFLLAAGIVVALFSLLFSISLVRNNKALAREKKRSEDLLLNILPFEVAQELKERGAAQARVFEPVTVLFTDFVDFTIATEQLSPQELIDELHECFKNFDEITAKYHIEKIKTIGDAYLAVGGLPRKDELHAENVVRAAIEIRDFMARRNEQLQRSFAVRIGIHSGSVVAGIVGMRKFAYDVWGDTVNTAARIEQNSAPGRVNISETTYELVKEKFTFEYRGEVKAKNKGKLNMYFVD